MKTLLLILFFLSAHCNGLLQYHNADSIAANDLPSHVKSWTGSNYRLVYLTGFEDEEDETRYNTIWHKNEDETRWMSSHGLTESQFELEVIERQEQGYEPVFVDGFSVTDPTSNRLESRLNTIYHKMMENELRYEVRVGLSSVEYQEYFDDMVSMGWTLQVVSTYQQAGQSRYACIFSNIDGGVEWASRHNLTLDQGESAVNDMMDNGFILVDVSAGTVENEEPRFSAIFHKKGPNAPKLYARINVQDAELTQIQWMEAGAIPHVIDAYKTRDGSLRWALLYTERVDYTVPKPLANGPTYPETACFDTIVTNWMEDNKIFGASAAVLKEGRIVYSQGYGYRDVPGIKADESRKVYPSTPFRTASVSKPVTSLTVFGLIQQGRLHLSDKVFGPGGILQSMTDNPHPCCPIVDNRIYQITVKHLLNHQAGFIQNYTLSPLLLYDNVREIQSTMGLGGAPECSDAIRFMLGKPLEYTPGQDSRYSNLGYCILKEVIAQVTDKQSYEETARQMFLDDACVDREEFFIGSTQLQDVSDTEAEYFCPGCPMVDSIFDEKEKVPYAYGAISLEASECGSAWVASAQQLMRMLASTTSPHCNGTVANQNDHKCLLWQTSVDTITSKPYFEYGGEWSGSGFDMFEYQQGLVWTHSGWFAGSDAWLERHDDWCSFAGITNTWYDYHGHAWLSEILRSAVQCVEESGAGWPAAYQYERCPDYPATSGSLLDTIGQHGWIYMVVIVLVIEL